MRANDMVVNTYLGTRQAAEIFLSLIGAGAVEAVGLLMVDPLHFVTVVQAISRRGFVGMYNRALADASADE
jgi:hypothetical protein